MSTLLSNGPGTEAPERPKLLFLGHNLPWPPDTGAKMRSFHLLRHLGRSFRVRLLCFSRIEHLSAPLDRSHQQLTEHATRLDVFQMPGSGEPMRFLWDHARSLLSGRAYTRYRYQSRDFRDRLRAEVSESPPDLVHVDSIDLSRYLPIVSEFPVVCGHHNIESELLARRAEADKALVRRLYLSFQSYLTRREERFWANEVALNVTCSEQDSERLTNIASSARTVVIANGVDIDYFRPGERTGVGVVFLGGADWSPNRNGMDFFATRVLPLIRSRRPDLKITWVGRADEADRSEYQGVYGIRMTGRVDDIRPHVMAASCMIVPLLVGGGTRLKILHGWAMGKAIVSTSVGCEGLRAEDGGNILIRDNAEDFAEAVLELHENDELRRKIEEGARQTAVTFYDWEVVGRRLRGAYLQLLSSQ